MTMFNEAELIRQLEEARAVIVQRDGEISELRRTAATEGNLVKALQFMVEVFTHVDPNTYVPFSKRLALTKAREAIQKATSKF